MGFTTKIMLNTTRQKKDGTYPLVIRLTYNTKVIYVPVGLTLNEKDWNAKNQEVRSNSKIATSITRVNNSIRAKLSNVYDVVTALETSGEITSMSMKDIKATIVGKKVDEEQTNVITFINGQMAEMRRAGRNGNADVYKTLRNKLINHCGHSDLRFKEINHKFLLAIENSHFANGGEKGGLSVYMRTLRAVFNLAIKVGAATKDSYPFDDYKIKKKKPVRKALTEADFTAFRRVDLSAKPHLERTRDLYIASFLMRGMNWMDMAYLTRENLSSDGSRITYVRNKTDEPFNMQINPLLQSILNKYKLRTTKKETFLFPILQGVTDANKYHDTIRNKRLRLNQYLKVIATMADIEPFSIYSARHTYATLSKLNGVPTNIIQEAMGHSTEGMTQDYLDSFGNDVLDKSDESMMEKVLQ